MTLAQCLDAAFWGVVGGVIANLPRIVWHFWKEYRYRVRINEINARYRK